MTSHGSAAPLLLSAPHVPCLATTTCCIPPSCTASCTARCTAGIPDFRSEGTGLYHRLEEYGLPHPHAVFEIDYFRRNPRPFFLLAKELFPGSYLPTPTHHFMRLLHDKGLLLRCFTQASTGQGSVPRGRGRGNRLTIRMVFSLPTCLPVLP